MNTWRRDNVRLAVANLKGAKTRSFLTMLGIVIGIMAVILVVCIGEGVKKQISGQIHNYGADIVSIRPGTQTSGLSAIGNIGGNGLPVAASSLLTSADVATVAKTPGVVYAVPLAVASGSASGDHTVASPMVVATTAELPDAIKQPIAQGGFFDANTNDKTVVLGSNIARQLFDDSVPLGQTLTYRGQDFIVTGIFSDFTAAPFSITANFNNAIFLPYSTAQTLNGGTLAVYQILAKTDAKNVSATVLSINNRLIAAHGGSQLDSVLTADQTNAGSNEIIHSLTLLIIGVALIAFIVGGIGIMDVMLVSVTERMHEIGLRKAIGATNRQILRQFMTEALVLSTTGAVIGVVLSLAAVGLLRVYSGLQPVVVWQVLLIAPAAAVVVGVLFGTAPAFKAARKDPIEALRHE